jgi:hypothetical protein
MNSLKKSFNFRMLSLICISFFFASQLFAGTIKGKIIDNKNKPLEFASASLINSKTMKFVKGEVSNEKGEFVIDKVSPGEYVLAVTMVGYAKHESEKLRVDAKENRIIEKTIVLNETSHQLAAVEVVSKKKFIEQTVDKVVINPDASITSASENVYEIMKKLPGVSIDNNDNISLKGKQGVKVLIDDKPTYVSADQLATILKSMQGKNIERIEIMENPPARFDAEGNSGIINIKTKHAKAPGFNGSVNAGASYSGKIRENGALDLNLKSGKFNLYGNYAYNDWRGWNSMDGVRNFTSPDMLGVSQHIYNYGIYDGLSHNYKIGADYFIKKNHVISVMFRGTTGSNIDTDNNITAFKDINMKVDSSLNTITKRNNNWYSNTYNANYKWDIDSTGRMLTVDADYSRFSFRSGNVQNVSYFDANGTKLSRTGNVSTDQGEDIDIFSAKVDYVHPINKIWYFEAGLKTSFVTNNSQIAMNGLLTQNDKFIYNENTQAAYVSGRAQLDKTTVQLGLRAENTNTQGNSVSTGQVDKKSYLKLFPTLFVQQTLNKDNTMNLSYSYRIGRPNYDMLNPFKWMVDPYTYNVGNPNLQPQFTHSVSLSHSFKGALITTVGYSYTKDLFTIVLLQNDANKSISQTTQNMSSAINFNASETVQLPITKWWRINGTVTGMYNQMNSQVDGNVTFNLWSVMANASTTFSLPYKVDMELSGNYSSKLLIGNFTITPGNSIDLGFQKKVLTDKGMIRLSFDDIFNIRAQGGYSKTSKLDISVVNKYDSQRINLSFSYRFGKDDFQTRGNRQTASSEEQRRTGK